MLVASQIQKVPFPVEEHSICSLKIPAKFRYSKQTHHAITIHSIAPPLQRFCSPDSIIRTGTHRTRAKDSHEVSFSLSLSLYTPHAHTPLCEGRRGEVHSRLHARTAHSCDTDARTHPPVVSCGLLEPSPSPPGRRHEPGAAVLGCSYSLRPPGHDGDVAAPLLATASELIRIPPNTLALRAPDWPGARALALWLAACLLTGCYYWLLRTSTWLASYLA